MGAKSSAINAGKKALGWKTNAWNTGKRAVNNIRRVGFGGGEYASAAISGALGWGAFSGVTEWAQGGSFWDGAVGGAMTGAMARAGYRAAKIGATGSGWRKATISNMGQGYKNAWNGTVGTFKRKPTVSKSVRDIAINRENSRKAQYFMNNRKK